MTSTFRGRRWSWAGACALVVMAAALMAAPVAAQTTAPQPAAPGAKAPTPKKAKDEEKRGLVWDDRPSIVFSKNVRVDVRFKAQLDWRAFSPEIGEDLYSVDAKRAGIKGELTKHFEFEIEREISKVAKWKDVYFNWKTFRQMEVKGGRFKIPFGMEQLTGKGSTDFAYRSLMSSTIAPARDRGVMVHGRLLGRALTYEVGGFKGDGDNGKLTQPQFVQPGDAVPEVGPSFVGRITATPLRALPAGPLTSLRLGVAYTNGNLPEGLNSLRGRSEFGTATYFAPVYVKGRRQRTGAELEWTPGPVGIKAEWMQSREDRIKQGNRNQDLSDFLGTGWYASGTWVVTGEKKESDIVPRKPLFAGGIGAIEVGVKYDELGFGSAAHTGPAFQNPRADNLIGAKNRVWTAGVNWYPNRWVRLIGNAIHEDFVTPMDTPASGETKYWAGLLRLQVAF